MQQPKEENGVMCEHITDEQAQRLRETLLKLVYLDEWDLHVERFPMERFRAALRQCRHVSQVLAWIIQEGGCGRAFSAF